HKGKPMRKVPMNYLTWLSEQDWISGWEDLHEYIKGKIDQPQTGHQRGDGEEPPPF
ncbi:unnamed protein product, partial [marine sediment metagenome]